jgi:hypothetical protein
VDRLSSRAVPDDDRLALIGDADAGDAPPIDLAESPTTARVSRQICSGSCSTQPLDG